MQTVQLVNHYTEEILQDILIISRDSFPSGWQFADADKYYREMLSDKNNIHILLIDDGKRVGYLHAIPHNEAVKELNQDDPDIRDDAFMYYVESVGILPGFRGRKGFSKMLTLLMAETKKRGISKLSLHARVTNSLSEIICRKFKATPLRRIEKWRYYNFEEPTDYFEVSF